jgi:hypothetical protein
MREHTGRSYREWVVSASVLVGHVVLVLLFARVREQERTPDSVSRSRLVFIEGVPPVRPLTPMPEPELSTSTAISVPIPRVDISGQPEPEPATSSRRIDWQADAERSAHNAIREMNAPRARGFEERAPPEPERKPRPFEWAPPRAGFSGGLPYVRVGKRCAIGLGFFGCGLGELPPANGKLFEDMNDPDRERSSVPSHER